MAEQCPFCGCEQVDWRASNGRIGWTCGTCVGGPVLPPSQSESCRIRQLEAEVAEYEATFALQRERMGEATAAWQAATGKTDRLPDLGDLLSWLLGRIAEGEAARELAEAALDMEYSWHPDENFRCYCPCCDWAESRGHAEGCRWGTAIAAYRAARDAEKGEADV